MTHSLLALLVTAGDATRTPSDRKASGGHIALQLRGWAGGFLGRRFGNDLAKLDDTADDLVLDAITHVVVQATVGTAPFRGTSEGEAYKWCQTLLTNFVTDRQRSLAGRRRKGWPTGEIEKFAPGGETVLPDPWFLQSVLDAANAVIARKTRAQDLDGALRNVRVHLEALRGDAIEEQLERYGFVGRFDAEPRQRGTTAWLRARDRVYKYRGRGRDALAFALDTLELEGTFASDELLTLRRCLLASSDGPDDGSTDGEPN